jgi:hypothetical protein
MCRTSAEIKKAARGDNSLQAQYTTALKKIGSNQPDSVQHTNLTGLTVRLRELKRDAGFFEGETGLEKLRITDLIIRKLGALDNTDPLAWQKLREPLTIVWVALHAK